MAYTTIQDLRNRGVTEEEASDETLVRWIQFATEKIDNYCRQFFEAREGAILFDGLGHNTLYLDPYYLRSISELKINGESIKDFDIAIYGRFIKGNNVRFPRGNHNIEIRGIWGRYEKVPVVVNEACIQLVLDEVRPDRKKSYKITSERIGDYSYSTSTSTGAGSSSTQTTGNPEVDDLLKPLVLQQVRIGTTTGRKPLTRGLWPVVEGYEGNDPILPYLREGEPYGDEHR